MNAHRWRKWLSNGLLLAGSALLLFLFISQWMMSQKEQALIDQLEGLSSMPPEDVTADPSPPSAPPAQTTAAMPPVQKTQANEPHAVALLQIPKIDLRVPVAEGSSAAVLNVAVGHLEQTGQLGKSGQNFVLVGHRSHTFGRFFNRLDDMALSDPVILQAQGKTYTYRVIDKQIIAPTNVEVIRPVAGKSRVTLITCHPEYSDRQRLVVTAELQP